MDIMDMQCQMEVMMYTKARKHAPEPIEPTCAGGSGWQGAQKKSFVQMNDAPIFYARAADRSDSRLMMQQL
jgi:hypothetical protein